MTTEEIVVLAIRRDLVSGQRIGRQSGNACRCFDLRHDLVLQETKHRRDVLECMLLFPLVCFSCKISYSLYLVHPLVGNRILYFGSSRYFKADQFLLTAIAFCSAMLISIIASYVVYRLVEQPSVRIAQRVYGRLMPRKGLN